MAVAICIWTGLLHPSALLLHPSALLQRVPEAGQLPLSPRPFLSSRPGLALVKEPSPPGWHPEASSLLCWNIGDQPHNYSLCSLPQAAFEEEVLSWPWTLVVPLLCFAIQLYSSCRKHGWLNFAWRSLDCYTCSWSSAGFISCCLLFILIILSAEWYKLPKRTAFMFSIAVWLLAADQCVLGVLMSGYWPTINLHERHISTLHHWLS